MQEIALMHSWKDMSLHCQVAQSMRQYSKLAASALACLWVPSLPCQVPPAKNEGHAEGVWCADPATLSSPAPGSADMVAYEQKAGLRPVNDHLPDRERRQQVSLLVSMCLSASSFQVSASGSGRRLRDL